MRLGILHLSDIHFRHTDIDTDADSLLAKQICTAIATELIGTTYIAVIVSGDIAFSGLRSEYDRASDWFTELYTLIDDSCKATCAFFFSPGNHDVDHAQNRETRTAVINHIRSQPQFATNVDMIQECTKEQQEFVKFQDELEDLESLVFRDALLRVHRIHHDSSVIQINLLNTAWISQLEERQGSLFFPIDQYVDQLISSNGFSITVMHHPLNWFAPENTRMLRDDLMRTSSIVCFGHEHMPDTKRASTALGDHVLYVDGGVLNEKDAQTRSSFNLLVLNVKSEEIRHIQYERIDERFVPENQYNLTWQDASKLLSAESSSFRLKLHARNALEDMGLNVLHPSDNELRIRDLFVYPDLLPMNQREAPAYERLERTVTSEHILYKQKSCHVILEGEEKIGKTALLRMLFSEFYNRGKIPLLLKGSRINSNSLESIRRSIGNAFGDTYDGANFVQFEQLESTDRVILVDDFRFDERGREKAKRLLQFLSDYSGYVVITTHTFMTIEELLVQSDSSVISQEYEVYTVQEFGHQKRNELIGRWLQLGRFDQGWNSPAVLEERDSARKTINTIIGRNFVPSTPIFVLVILQSISSTSVNTVGSTYGDYYQFLITRSLMHAGVRPEDLDAYLNYVTELAHELYENERELRQSRYFEWHMQFCEEYAIEWRHDNTISTMKTAGILEETPTGNVRMRFRYIYYFFLARYVARRLADQHMREKVKFMCDRLHVSEYANVILFIVHHSDNPFVLDSLRSATASLMSGMEHFRFEMDVDNGLLSWINSLPSEIRTRNLENRDPQEVEQKRELRQRDIAEAEQNEREGSQSMVQELDHRQMNELSILSQSNVSAKAIDLLGQVLKNYYGSLKVENGTLSF